MASGRVRWLQKVAGREVGYEEEIEVDTPFILGCADNNRLVILPAETAVPTMVIPADLEFPVLVVEPEAVEEAPAVEPEPVEEPVVEMPKPRPPRHPIEYVTPE